MPSNLKWRIDVTRLALLFSIGQQQPPNTMAVEESQRNRRERVRKPRQVQVSRHGRVEITHLTGDFSDSPTSDCLCHRRDLGVIPTMPHPYGDLYHREEIGGAARI
jgi:hypothetical protein